MKVLMVCLGNICRSPLAEGILRHKVKLKAINWEIDSAGTGGWHTGQQPDSRAIRVAGIQGIDISTLRARQINEFDLEYFDLILTMDQSNLRDVLKLKNTIDNKKKILLVSMYSVKYKDIEVPDPYYDTEKEFLFVYEMLDEVLDCIIEKYSKQIPQ
jgi:protein-tyrosine phosphatase